MKARAKIQVVTEHTFDVADGQDTLDAAKAEVQILMRKLLKVAVKVRCISLTVEADETDLVDLE